MTTSGATTATGNTLPPAVNVTSEDRDVCMKDFEGLQQQSCLANFFTRKAIKESDQQVCENIVVLEVKNGCINNVLTMRALFYKDASLCEEIKDQEGQSVCRNSVQLSKAGSQSGTSTVPNGRHNIQRNYKEVTR